MLTTQICQTTERDVQSVIEMTFLAAQCMYDYFLLRANSTLFFFLCLNFCLENFQSHPHRKFYDTFCRLLFV